MYMYIYGIHTVHTPPRAALNKLAIDEKGGKKKKKKKVKGGIFQVTKMGKGSNAKGKRGEGRLIIYMAYIFICGYGIAQLNVRCYYRQPLLTTHFPCQ